MTTSFQFISAAVSDRGLSPSRPHNEDSFVDLPAQGFFAVADGVGGAQAGEIASQMAVDIVSEAFIDVAVTDPAALMRTALENANAAIFRTANEMQQLESMATTIVALQVSGGVATIAHAGDSRIYRMDRAGHLFRETVDHSVVEEEVQAGRMTPEQALNHPSRNVISRALGAESSVEPEIKRITVDEGTAFLLCTDGITRHISDDELQSLMSSGHGPADVCSRMKEICFSRGAEDNLTALIVECHALTESIETVDAEEDTVPGLRIPVEALPIAAVTPQPTGSRTRVDISDPAEVPEEPAITHSAFPSAAPERRSSGAITAVGMLVLGSLLGAALGYFIWGTTAATVVPQPVNGVETIAPSSFEETRRKVDADPAKFLAEFPAESREAADLYFRGRALLLTGKAVEARRAFEEARNLLASTADQSSTRTMANDIAIGIALSESEPARQELMKQLSPTAAGQRPASNAGGTTNSTNTNAAQLR